MIKFPVRNFLSDGLSYLSYQVLRRSNASDEPTIKDIVKSTFAVMFLGTPHRGSAELAALGQVVRWIAGCVLRFDSNEIILRALSVDGPELELARESFITQWRLYGFRVKTFHEGLGMTSANVGIMNEKVNH